MPTTENILKLSIYRYDGCFFCNRVHATIERLQLEVEARNIFGDRQHMEDLLAARRRRTVPVLRIDYGDGQSVWLPESSDITAFLETCAKNGDGPPAV